jgi:hypothetical protein
VAFAQQLGQGQYGYPVGVARKLIPAIAYLRTSSAANVGADKDSDRRQREAIAAFAGRAGYELVAEFYDAAVSGADPIDTRPGFAAMLERIEGNGRALFSGGHQLDAERIGRAQKGDLIIG